MMTDGQRAKIFAPYAALRGFGSFILDAQQSAEERVLLGEDAQEELNRQLQRLRIGDMISVKYYRDDRYVETVGAVKRIDTEERELRLGTLRIPLEDILVVGSGEPT